MRKFNTDISSILHVINFDQNGYFLIFVLRLWEVPRVKILLSLEHHSNVFQRQGHLFFMVNIFYESIHNILHNLRTNSFNEHEEFLKDCHLFLNTGTFTEIWRKYYMNMACTSCWPVTIWVHFPLIFILFSFFIYLYF